MTHHEVQTRNHNVLLVDLEHVPNGDGYGRTWRTVLADPPPRLRHLLAVWTTEQDEALTRLQQAADGYAGNPLVPRWPGHGLAR